MTVTNLPLISNSVNSTIMFRATCTYSLHKLSIVSMTKQSTVKIAKLQKIKLDNKVTDGYYKTLSKLLLLFSLLVCQNRVTYSVALATYKCPQLY